MTLWFQPFMGKRFDRHTIRCCDGCALKRMSRISVKRTALAVREGSYDGHPPVWDGSGR